LVESIERQLSRPSKHDLNAANAYINVAMSRASEAKRFFGATGRQIQDMQVSRDHLPATVLMTNAMNTSKDLDDLLCQDEIPRLLNQELKERKPPKQSVEPHHSKVLSSSSKEFSAQSSSDLAPLNLAVPNHGKRKDEQPQSLGSV
jgi:hypothetical protein